ncbi:MAG: beta-propeller fold lactonase family protein [Syntrophomonas sp.]|nr:beta-propeller fold lactonase family protein [Syntrophomonas sp.]
MNRGKRRRIGVVYAMTNAAPSNEVIAFSRGINGKLTRLNAYETGGSGTGTQTVDPLASQGSLILSHDGCFLFAVNAGSNSISSFRVSSCGRLTLVDVEPSGGVKPNSLAVFHHLLYVTNAGNAATNIASNVTGFHVNRDGSLTQIIGSTHSLSTANAQPSCVVFSPRGHKIVVSELNSNLLSVFLVNSNGTLTGPTINNSNGAGPFGSVFLSKGFLLVSEAGPNALSSYTAAADGTLTVVSGSVLNGQAATCWVSSSPHEHFAYTSNAGNDTITIYRIKKDGRLAVVASVPSTPDGTAAPLDSGVSRHGRNFYVLNGNEGSISVFRIRRNGGLIRLQVFEATGLPELGAQGLAVY